MTIFMRILLRYITLFYTANTVFPQIRPVGIIFLQSLQLRVLLERGYYSRAGIIIRTSKILNPATLMSL